MLNPHPYRANSENSSEQDKEFEILNRKPRFEAKFAMVITVLCLTIAIALKYLGIIRVLMILWQLCTWLIGGFVALTTIITLFIFGLQALPKRKK